MSNESEPSNENLMKNSWRDLPALKDANQQSEIHLDAHHLNLKMFVYGVSPPLP